MNAGYETTPSAVERLAMSRERLRGAMRERSASANASRHAPGEMPGWLKSVASVPGLGIVIDGVRSWWNQHPMRVASTVALDAAKSLLSPVIQRNPVGLVVGALVVGGLLAWAKPWRGFLKPALFAGLLPQLISKVVAHVPVESWMAVLSSFGPQPDSHQSADGADADGADASNASGTSGDSRASASPPQPTAPPASSTLH